MGQNAAANCEARKCQADNSPGHLGELCNDAYTWQ